MKRSIAFLLAAVMMVGNVYAKDITVTLNDEEVNFDAQQPVIVEGRTLIPLRGVFEKLGYTVVWDGNTKTATLSNKEKSIDVTANSSTMTVNKDTVSLDVPAQIINGSMMLPLRAVGEASGLDVEWNSDSKTVVLNAEDKAPASETTENKVPDNDSKNISSISSDTADYARTAEYICIATTVLLSVSDSFIYNILTMPEEDENYDEMFTNIRDDIDLNTYIMNNLSPQNDSETKIKALILEMIDVYSEMLKIMELENSGGITEDGAEKTMSEYDEKMKKILYQLDSALNQYTYKANGFFLENFDTGNLNDADTERLGEFIDKLSKADSQNQSEIARTDLTSEMVLKTPLHYAKDLRETAKARDDAFAKIESEPDFDKRVEILLCANDMLEKAADVLEKYNDKKLDEAEATAYFGTYLYLYDMFNIDGADGMFKEILEGSSEAEFDLDDFDFNSAFDMA